MANKAIVATKVGMTQLWDDDNQVVPVTMLQVEPCRVVQVKTDERDGYTAVQVTFGQRDIRKLSKPEAGHFDAAGIEPGQRLVELRLDDVSEIEVGQELAADVLEPGEKVDVMDVLEVKKAGEKAVEHAVSGKGPYILEMTTYRYRGHSMSDPAAYRSKTEVQKIRTEKDPLDSLKLILVKNGYDT